MRVGKIIALVSSKGGSGKSTVAVGLAAAFSSAKKNVLLIDADEGARCLDIMLDISGDTVFDIKDVLDGNASCEDAAMGIGSLPSLKLIPSPFENKPLDFSRLAEFAVKESENFDFVIIDTKGQLPASRLAELSNTATFVSVVTPEPVALKNTGALTLGLSENGIKSRLIINRFKTHGNNGNINNVDNIIDTCGARLLGVVPEDRNISLFAGKPIVFGSAAKAVFRIAARLEGENIPLPKISSIL